MKNDKKLSVKELLQKYKLDDKDIYRINYHMSILSYDAKLLIFKILGINDMEEQEMANKIYEMILKCDATNPEYEQKLDEEMTRLGMKANQYYGGHSHSVRNYGLFEDDGFGFGRTPGDIYDTYIDSLGNDNVNDDPQIK